MNISMNNAGLINSLFSGMNGGNSSGNSFQSDMLGINYMDYSNIQSGSYYKLMKAYYANTDGEGNPGLGIDGSKENTATNAKIQTDADALKKSAEALTEQGSKSLFKKVTTTDKDGNKTEGYDTDKIYKAVEEFVKNYNSVVKSAGSSNINGITTAAGSMVNMARINSKMLDEMGITIDSENLTMKLDKEAFQKADMNAVKGLFNDRGSFGYRVSVQASMISHSAKSEAAKANTYNGFGQVSNTNASGNMWDRWI